jgi:hypothetical protein
MSQGSTVPNNACICTVAVVSDSTKILETKIRQSNVLSILVDRFLFIYDISELL